MKRLLALCLLFAGLAFATPSQSSLYEEALYVEEQGNLTLAISLFSRALEVGGIYDSELQEILTEYENAAKATIKPHFSFETSGKYFYFDENANDFYASESFGCLSSKLYGGVEFIYGDYAISFGGNFTFDYFLKRDSTVLDTNSFYGTPALAFSLQGNTFLLDVDFGLEIDSDSRFLTNSFFEKDVWRNKNNDFTLDMFLHYLEKERIRAEVSAVWHYGINNSKWSHSVSLGANFTRDSIYCMKEVSHMDSLERHEFLFTSVPLEYEFMGNTSMLLGPKLLFSALYRINDAFLVRARAGSFLGIALENEKRTALDIETAFRFIYTRKRFDLYAGPGVFFRRYLQLPEMYRYTVAEKRILFEMELGFKADF